MGWGSSYHYCIHMASFPATLPLHMQLICFPTTIAMLHLSCSFRPTSPSFDDHVYSTNNFPACVLTRFPTTIVMLRLSCSMRPPSPHFVYHNCTTTTSPPVPCFVYHGQPYHHPSFLHHVLMILMCATTRANIKIPFCCSSSLPLTSA